MVRGIVEANEIEFQRPILRLALDAKDAWNWQSFAQALGSAGYMPSNVTLTSLKITDGVLALHGPDGDERTRLEGLNGELSAPALDGPYRFRGVFVSGGAEREIRLATATPESGRRRAPARFPAPRRHRGHLPARRARGRPDGQAAHRRRSHGPPADRRPLAAASARQRRRRARRAGAEDEHKLDKSEAAFELKAAVKADVAGAELSDLSLTFEQDGRPQIVTGQHARQLAQRSSRST